MPLTYEELAAFIWWCLAVITLCCVPIMMVFYRKLRTRHPEVWASLGSPTLFYSASVRNQRAVSRFIWRGEYRKLKDTSITVIVRWIVFLSKVGVVLFATWLAAFCARVVGVY